MKIVTLLQIVCYATTIMSQDEECPVSSPCVAAAACPWYQRKTDSWRDLPESDREEVRGSVCNKADRKVCCRSDCGDSQTCKHYNQCPWYHQKKEQQKALVKGSPEYGQITKELKRSICDKELKKVCCPDIPKEAQGNSSISSVCPLSSPCISSSTCPWYQEELKALKQAKRTPQYNQLLATIKGSVCNKSQRKVCCPLSQSQVTVTRDPNSPAWLPSPAKEECGQGRRDPSRITNGNNTRIGEFPWAVLLGRRPSRDDEIYWFCGGTLINRWFVLTAAHCVSHSLNMVRLGEWRVEDISQPDIQKGLRYSASQEKQCPKCLLVDGTMDCEVMNGRPMVCGPPHQDIEVGEMLRHPHYRILRRTGVGLHDIALLKLKTPATFNGLVSPACLPLERCEVGRSLQLDGCDLNNLVGKSGIAVGWGQTYLESDEQNALVASHVQKKVELPFVNGSECGDRYSELFRRNVLGDINRRELLCAGGDPGKDTCKGDSGGQLVMQSSGPQWLMGVVATGTRQCGIGLPAIFTNVDFYMDWIKQNIG